LGGESLQAHCPSYILRYDMPELMDNATVDCHRQARYLSFEQQFGQLQPHEQLREDRYIYRAVEEACQQLLEMLQMPKPLSEYEAEGGTDGITTVLVREIRTERVLLQRCQHEFHRRQQELEPRPVPTALAEPLARLRAGETSGAGEPAAGGRLTEEDVGSSGFDGAAGGFSVPTPVHVPSPMPMPQASPIPQSSYGRDPGSGRANAYASASSRGTAASAAGEVGGVGDLADGVDASSSFAASVDRSRVDQLLQRLQQGASLVG